MENAIAQYLAATTALELIEAYMDLVETYAADNDLPEDADFESGVDAMLHNMNLPIFAVRANEVLSSIERGTL